MANILSSILDQAVRGKIILGWSTFPALVTLPKLMKLPSLGMVTQPWYGYPEAEIMLTFRRADFNVAQISGRKKSA